MCRYRYIYYSRCQHAECYKVSYCPRAIDLGLPQRDNHYSRGTNPDVISARPSAYSPSPSSAHSSNQHFIMSTLRPTEAGGASSLVSMPPTDYPDQAALVPRSARQDMEQDSMQSALLETNACRNVNIAIPLNSPSTMSVEFTNDGKVTELVARFETYSETEHSDTSQATPGHRSRDSSLATVYPDDDYQHDPNAPSISGFKLAAETDPSPETTDTRMQRKPLPVEWVEPQTTPPTRRGAPMLRTEMRSSEREKRKATQSCSPPKSLRGARKSTDLSTSGFFLTKEKSKAASPSSSEPSASAAKTTRNESKSSFKSLPQSPLRGPAKSQVLFPGYAKKPSGSSHLRTSSLESTGDTEFYSAGQSPVSPVLHGQLTRWGSDEDEDDDVTFFDLADPDDDEQKTRNEEASKPTAMKLSLNIPSDSNNHRMPLTPGSASTPSSGSPIRSKIPRIYPRHPAAQSSAKLHSTLHARLNTDSNKESAGAKESASPTECQGTLAASQPKTPKAVRHVKTVDSTGATPILTKESLALGRSKPDTHSMVRSYLKLLPDRPSSAEKATPSSTVPPPDLKQVVGKMLSESASLDRVESPTVSSTSATNAMAAQATIPDETALNDPAIIYSRKRSTSSDNKESSHQDNPTNEVSEVSKNASSGAPHDIETIRSRDSLISDNAISELRATAPEFVPSEGSSTITNMFLPFDPFALDSYGIPWLYHMYPVSLAKSFGWFKQPKKNKTVPRNRKHGNRTSPSSPRKALDDLEKIATQTVTGFSSPKAVPFSAQLDEVSRVRTDGAKMQGTQTLPTRGYGGRLSRHSGNGLYDNFNLRHIGIPIEEGVPFPDPIPPSGAAARVGHVVETRKGGCGSVVIEAALEWGGGNACNQCEPDH